MKYKKILALSALTLLISGCSCTLNLYEPEKNNVNYMNPALPDKVSVINESNYTGTINYAPNNQNKLTKEEVYNQGVTSSVYIIASNNDESYLGSGVFFSEDEASDGNAYLFTNAHVVSGATNIEIVYSNYKRNTAKIVGYHVYEDIAVLSVKKNTNYTIATLKTSDKLNVASEVITIGTPIDFSYSFVSTSGVISKIDTPLASTYDNNYGLLLLQIDASLNSGNSGGPLFDLYGNLIGLNTMKIVYDNNLNTIDDFNFAIPIERAVFIANKIFNNSHYKRGLLGISIVDIIDLSLAQRSIYNITLDYGLYVMDVSNTGASFNKLENGDIITKINGKSFTNKSAFEKELYNFSEQETISLTVYRNNEELNFNITLK